MEKHMNGLIGRRLSVSREMRGVSGRWALRLVALHLLLFGVFLLALLKTDHASAREPNCSTRLRTSAAVALDGQTLGADTIIYQTVFTEKNWAGDLIAACIDARGETTSCRCEQSDGGMDVCSEPFSPGFPEIKWSADTIAWQIDTDLHKNPEDGWWKRRAVLTYSDQAGGGVPFDYQSISDSQRAWLNNDPDLVAFLRGDRSLEGERFRSRSSYYGDFRNSIPLSYASILLAGANDGMLHLFDKQTGHELFSYMPNLLMSQWVEESSVAGRRSDKLALLADEDYENNHHYFVDAAPAVRYLDDQTTTLAVGSLGRGGKGIYALNLFGIKEMGDIESSAADVVMWEYPDPAKDRLQEVAGKLIHTDESVDESADRYSDTITPLSTDPYLGEVHAAPKIVKLPYPNEAGYRWSVVFGNGYHSYNQTPVLYILDAYDGSVVKRVQTAKKEDNDQSGQGSGCTTEFGCNGLSSTVLVDDDEDTIIDYGYGGDLSGNLWKFDFTSGAIYGADGYSVAFHDPGDFDSDGTPEPRPLISVRDKQGNPQPITTEPTVTRPCTSSGEGMMVLFGTGWLDPAVDGGSTTQSIYGIWDWQNYWRSRPDSTIYPESAYYGELGPASGEEGRSLSNLPAVLAADEAGRISLLEQTQQSFVGLNYFGEQDPAVLGGQARAGELYSISDNPSDFSDYQQVVRTLSSRRINWFSAAALAASPTADKLHLGWFFDLPFGDEQVASDPKVLDGVLYYATSLWTETECGLDGSNRMIMAHDSCSGGAAETIVFDLNSDQMMNSNDAVVQYNPDGSTVEDTESKTIQAGGLLVSNSVSSPTIAAGKDHDTLFAPTYLSDNSGTVDDKLIEAGSQPEIVKNSVRGRNLGMTFWRELY